MKKLFPDDTILTTNNFEVGQDWEVPISAFFIIGALDKTKRSILDFSDSELTELILAAKKVRKAMTDFLKIKDVYIFQNEDTEHGFHIWLFPRHEWMEKFGRKIESVRAIMNYSKNNMTDEENIQDVKKTAKEVREFLYQSQSVSN